MAKLPPFLRKDPRSTDTGNTPVSAVQHHSRGDVVEAHALWWPPVNSGGHPTTILYLIPGKHGLIKCFVYGLTWPAPGNPGQVEYFHYFLEYLHKLHPELGILAKAHLGHTPGYCKTASKDLYGLSSQVDSALETVRSLKETYPHAKVVLVLEAQPEETEAAFLLMPPLSNLATSPNGLKLAVLSEWPDQQLAVVRGMLGSPTAITSALGMARDEMASVKDLETPLLKKHSEKIYLYCASKDDWVGKEKEGVIAALGGLSERVVEDGADTPHAFVITE
ncbi:hypothetical protein FRC01_008198, partial [Tulasnella sp. 417]